MKLFIFLCGILHSYIRHVWINYIPMLYRLSNQSTSSKYLFPRVHLSLHKKMLSSWVSLFVIFSSSPIFQLHFLLLSSFTFTHSPLHTQIRHRIQSSFWTLLLWRKISVNHLHLAWFSVISAFFCLPILIFVVLSLTKSFRFDAVSRWSMWNHVLGLRNSLLLR